MNDFPERFNNAIDNLVDAFMNDDLEAGYCSKCAVGNMCNGWEGWKEVFLTTPALGHRFKENHPRYDEINSEAVSKSEYNLKELSKIEKTFENARKEEEDYNSTEDQFNRLMAVVDVLMEIDDINEEHESDIKNKFVVA